MNCRDTCYLKIRKKRPSPDKSRDPLFSCFRRMLNPAKGIAIIPGIKRSDEEGKYYCFEGGVRVSL